MKKLINLFSSIALIGLLFIGCQSTEDITSPVDLEKGPPAPPTFEWGTPAAVNPDDFEVGDVVTVDLVAGQTMLAGYVEVERFSATQLKITYFVNTGWTLMETHLAVVADPADFPVNNGGNPVIGSFPYGGGAGPFYVDIPDGVDPATGNIYIGAHAVVENCEGVLVNGEICGNIPPSNVWRYVPYVNGVNAGDPYYLYQAELRYNELDPDPFMLVNGWCVDRERGGKGGLNVNVNFLCTYGESDYSCYVDYPENLPKVNWLINNKDVVAGATMRDFQGAIWILLDTEGVTGEDGNMNMTRVNALVAAANQHPDFVPGCDELVAVIMSEVGFDCEGTNYMQNFIIEIPVPCEEECDSETAWAFNIDEFGNPDDTSYSFPGANWFRYFGYRVAAPVE